MERLKTVNRKIWAIILAVSLILSLFAGVGLSLSTKAEEDFDLDIYLANLAFEEGNNPVNNGDPGRVSVVSKYSSIGNACAILDSNISKDFEHRIDSFEFWSSKPNPKNFVEYTNNYELKQEDYWLQLLLAIVKDSTTSSAALKAANNKYAKLVKHIGKKAVSYSSSSLGETKVPELDKTISDLTKADKKALNEYTKSILTQYNVLSKVGSGIDVVSAVLKGAKTVENVYKNVASLSLVSSESDEVFAVFKQMKKHTNNEFLRSALNKILSCQESANQRGMAALTDATIKSFLYVYDTFYDDLFSAVIDTVCPVLKWMFFAQTTGKLLVNILFSTDKLSENYYKMKAFIEVEQALHSASVLLGDEFLDNKNGFNAKAYNTSVEMYFRCMLEGCSYAQSFLDSIYMDSLVGKTLDKRAYLDVSDSIETMENTYELELDYQTNPNYYKEFLKADYPEMYTLIFGNDEENISSTTPVSGISVNGKHVVLGLHENNTYSIMYKVIPEQASNQWVTYSSSNPEVATVDSLGCVSAVSYGFSTITISTEDGNYSQTIDVQVVQHPESGVVVSGSCGESANYILYSSGILWISGEGAVDHLDLWHDNDPVLYEGKTYAEYIESLNIRVIVVEEGIEEICGLFYEKCDSVKKVLLPDSLTYISEDALSGMEKVDRLYLGSSFVGTKGSKDRSGEILDNPFLCLDNLQLETITVSDNNNYYKSVDNILLTKDGETVITSAQQLGGACVIPSGVKEIMACAFMGRQITSVSFPDSLECISRGAFADCKQLQDIYFGKGLKELGDNMSFAGCVSLKEVCLPSSLETYYYPFEECAALEELSFEEGTKEIQPTLIQECQSLKRIVLPSTIEESNLWFPEEFFSSLEDIYVYGMKTIIIGLGVSPRCVPNDIVFHVLKNSIAETEIVELNASIADGSLSRPIKYVVMDNNELQDEQLEEVLLPAQFEMSVGDTIPMFIDQLEGKYELFNYNHEFKETDTAKRANKFVSKDESIVTVDEKGNVTAHKAGTTTIIGSYGNKTAECEVTVGYPWAGYGTVSKVSLNRVSINGKTYELNLSDNSEDILYYEKTTQRALMDYIYAYKLDEKGRIVELKHPSVNGYWKLLGSRDGESYYYEVADSICLDYPLVEKSEVDKYIGDYARQYYVTSKYGYISIAHTIHVQKNETDSDPYLNFARFVPDANHLDQVKDTFELAITDNEFEQGDLFVYYFPEVKPQEGETFQELAERLPVLSSNEAVAKVVWENLDDIYKARCYVKAVNAGEATLTFINPTTGMSCSAKVVVTDKRSDAGKVETVALDRTSVTFTVGDSVPLAPTAKNPYGGTVTATYDWSSSDSSVVTVDKDGIAKGMKPGKASITATEKSTGKTATCEFVVEEGEDTVVVIKTPTTEVSVAQGRSQTVSVTLLNRNAVILNKPVVWASEDESVATVNQNGVITGKAPGTTHVTASVDGQSLVIPVTVTERQSIFTAFTDIIKVVTNRLQESFNRRLQRQQAIRDLIKSIVTRQ